MASSGQASPAVPPDAFDDRSGIVIGVVVFGLVWSTLMVSLRIFTRAKIIHQVGIDDYACVVALVRCISTSNNSGIVTDKTRRIIAGNMGFGDRDLAHDKPWTWKTHLRH